MENYNRNVQIRLSNKQFKKLKSKSKKAGLTQSDFIRLLIDGATLNEKPDEKFYVAMSYLSEFTNKLNDFIYSAKVIGSIDTYYLNQLLERWNNLLVALKEKYL